MLSLDLTLLIRVLKEGKHTWRNTFTISLLLNQEPDLFACFSVSRAAELEEFVFFSVPEVAIKLRSSMLDLSIVQSGAT